MSCVGSTRRRARIDKVICNASENVTKCVAQTDGRVVAPPSDTRARSLPRQPTMKETIQCYCGDCKLEISGEPNMTLCCHCGEIDATTHELNTRAPAVRSMTRRLFVLLFLQVTAVDGAVACSRPPSFTSHRRSSSLLARYSPSTTVECQSRRTAQTTARAASNVAEPSTLKWRPIHTGSWCLAASLTRPLIRPATYATRARSCR